MARERTQADKTGNGHGRLPAAGIDGFLSHFVFTIRLEQGELGGRVFSFTLPAAIQTVARTKPFVYGGRTARHQLEFPLPEKSELPRAIAEQDFLTVPPRFFQKDRETIWLQILNLDARGETEIGPLRIILGETFRREYPDIFQPSFGAAQSLKRAGLPARLFFSPNGVFETPIGAFRTRPKALLGARIDEIPPVGSNPTLLEAVPLDSVQALREAGEGEQLRPAATVLALSHPIDALLHGPGDELYDHVEGAIAR